MISASQLKKGIIIQIDNQAHIVESVSCQTPSARGGATIYKVRARNAVSGQKTDQSFKGDDGFKEADYQKRPVQFLYRDQHVFCFMDLEDFNQFELVENLLEDESNFLTEDMELTSVLIDGVVTGIQLPDTVILRITECDPGIKGSSATARTKTAVVETGFSVQVPEYLENGDVIKIDTRTGKYLSRA